MPYILPEDRQLLDRSITQLRADLSIDFPGDINYAISRIVWSIFEAHPSYNNANTLIGVLEAVKLEFYRRQVAPYEDNKIKENGDLS